MQLLATRRPSLTARAVTFVRARELARPPGERIVSDGLAPLFLSAAERATLDGLAALPRSMSEPWQAVDGSTSILCRHRYLDDALLAALPDVLQVLVMGAGYDTRAYRIPLGDRPTFELDQPAISRRKARIVADHPDRFAAGRPVRVETDFAGGSWPDDLLAAGFEPGAATFVVWEGVAMYLRRRDVIATLTGLRELCGPGSVLGMDLIGTASGVGTIALTAAAQSLRLVGEPARFVVPPREARRLLVLCGWQVSELLGSTALDRLATGGRHCVPGHYVLSAVPR